MHRRDFLHTATTGAVALSIPLFPEIRLASSSRMGMVVHSYASRWNAKTESKTYPGFSSALDLLEHAHQLGAGGVQTTVGGWTNDFSKKVRDLREKRGLYIEGSIGFPNKPENLPRFEQELIQAKEAGARVLRTVCSGGRRYEIYHAPEAFQEFKKTAFRSLQALEPLLRKHQVKLAVENHKDWRAEELVALLKNLSSEWVGVTLDFGNNLALLEDPLHVVEALAPYTLTTHVKDMAVEDYPDGFRLSEVPLGTGLLDLPRLVALCKKHNPAVTFNLEMITRDPLEIPCLKPDYWATFGDVSGADLARTLRQVRERKATLPRVSQRSAEERLAVEDQNIRACLKYSRDALGLV
ncbi:MAG: sugar phosphate isomerase/epimerase [Sphingobacteriaceae bacterium]|nr:sugar phosphate isomerase/epimerase [Cytophagaceae bacterium]